MMKMTSEPTLGVVHVASLKEFFRDSVDVAMATNRVRVDHHTTHYVVNLLTLFARSEELYGPDQDSPMNRPLALLLNDAAQASTPEARNHVLQRLGDVSLFLAGFFADGFRAAAVDMDYYVYMGGGAYHSLASHVRGTTRGRAMAHVYAELGEKFQDMVDVLNEVRESVRTSSDEDTLRIYELWIKTGSRRAERLLKRMGIHPIGSLTTHPRH